MQIRRYTSLFLAIMLLVSSLGLKLSMHFCGNQLASVSGVFEKNPSQKIDSNAQNCCCIGDTEPNSCCKDRVLDLKKDQKEVVIERFSVEYDFLALPFLPQKEVVYVVGFSKPLGFTNYYCNPNAPPLFKLYQQYILYA